MYLHDQPVYTQQSQCTPVNPHVLVKLYIYKNVCVSKYKLSLLVSVYVHAFEIVYLTELR